MLANGQRGADIGQTMPTSGQPIDVSWTWGSIVALALSTGFATAIFNQCFAWLKEAWQQRHKDRRSGRVLALSLVELLTRYAQECNSGARRNRLVAEEGGVGRPKLPVLPPYPDRGDWGPLPPELAARLQDLRNEADEAVRGIAETDHVLGPPEAFESATLLQVDLGYMAWDLAKRLRRHYGLGRYAGQSTFGLELTRHYRKNRQGFFAKIWHSLPAYRIRRRVSRRIYQWRRRWRARSDPS